MSRSRALEGRCAPGKREARANCGPLPPEFKDHLPERAFWQARRGPLAQTAQPLGKLCPGAGVIDRPDPVEDELTPGAITTTACPCWANAPYAASNASAEAAS